MAGLVNFRAIVKQYLDERAKTDKLFAKSYSKKSKTFEGCCNYIIAEAQKLAKSGKIVLAREEVFGMAVHYYDEDGIKAPAKATEAHIISPIDLDKPKLME